MMVLLRKTQAEKGRGSFSRKERKVQNLILAAAAWLHNPGSLRAGDAHAAMHAATRSRDATRRLRSSRVYDPYVYLGPLELTRTRH